MGRDGTSTFHDRAFPKSPLILRLSAQSPSLILCSDRLPAPQRSRSWIPLEWRALQGNPFYCRLSGLCRGFPKGPLILSLSAQSPSLILCSDRLPAPQRSRSWIPLEWRVLQGNPFYCRLSGSCRAFPKVPLLLSLSAQSPSLILCSDRLPAPQRSRSWIPLEWRVLQGNPFYRRLCPP